MTQDKLLVFDVSTLCGVKRQMRRSFIFPINKMLLKINKQTKNSAQFECTSFNKNVEAIQSIFTEVVR